MPMAFGKKGGYTFYKPMLRPPVLLIGLLILIGIAACTNRPPDLRPWSTRTAEQLETTLSMERARFAPMQAVNDLERALRLYAMSDNQEGQARCHLLLARLYLKLGESDLQASHLVHAERIARRLQHPVFLYDSALLRARLSGEPTDFEKALEYADTPLQKATVLTYLGRSGEAFGLIPRQMGEATEHPDDYAFILFRYANQVGDAKSAQRALDFYKQADNHQGIAGSLMLLGRLARDRGDKDLARDYMERALATSRALDDERKIRAVETMLEGL